MKLAIIGAGYVGLVTAACFAEMGNEVICVDSDAAKVEALEQGRIPIYEPGLEDYVKRNYQEHRLFFSTELGPAVQKSLVCFIAVGTPQDKDGSADLSMVLQVAREIGRQMNGYKVIVEKSTVPVGTAVQVRRVIEAELRARGEVFEFDVVSNPEFLKEGTAIDDFMKPDRIVAGCDEVRVAELMKELYAPFVRTNHPIIVMDVVSAELTKYAANAFLATKISFINEIANICSRTGANINMVRRGIGSDRRVGPLFLFPGLGYGGSCFPKDMQALIHTANSLDYPPRLLEAAEAVNQDQRRIFVEVIRAYYKDGLKGRVFAVWGLSFKPQTDDIRVLLLGAVRLTVGMCFWARKARLPRNTSWPLPGLHPQPRQRLKILHPRQNQVFHRGGVGHGLGQGMLRFSLQRRGQGQYLSALQPSQACRSVT